ncbi:MAG: hypothetical protein EKK57_02630 [Proteobacteria bacterium]|nr:MAG: hypothetical protein EKK57_02630 [Pseudomonadota bacterium]
MKRNLVLSLILLSSMSVTAFAAGTESAVASTQKKVMPLPESSMMPVMVQRTDLVQSMPNTIIFANQESRVSPQLAPILAWNASYIQAFPAAKIKIVGHATEFKNEAKDDKLALQRAENVRTILFTMGVPYENTEVVSEGNDKPAFKQDFHGGPERNNRVDIFYTENAPKGYYVDKIPVVKIDEFKQTVVPMPLN